MTHLDETRPPNLDDPDWPATCPEARTRRGERQRLCRHCQRWAWLSTPCGRLRAEP